MHGVLKQPSRDAADARPHKLGSTLNPKLKHIEEAVPLFWLHCLPLSIYRSIYLSVSFLYPDPIPLSKPASGIHTYIHA